MAAALGTTAMRRAYAAPAETRAPVHTVPFVDLNRYAGDWYEIARFPNRFQRQCCDGANRGEIGS